MKWHAEWQQNYRRVGIIDFMRIAGIGCTADGVYQKEMVRCTISA